MPKRLSPPTPFAATVVRPLLSLVCVRVVSPPEKRRGFTNREVTVPIFPSPPLLVLMTALQCTVLYHLKLYGGTVF